MPKNTISKTKNSVSNTKKTIGKTQNSASKVKNTTSKIQNSISKTKKSQKSTSLKTPPTTQSTCSTIFPEFQSNHTKTPSDLVSIVSMLNELAQNLLECSKMPQSDARCNLGQILDQAEQAIQSEQDKISKPYPLYKSKHVKFWYDLDKDVSLSYPIHNYIEAEYVKNEFNAEIRCFYVLADNVRKEYELIQKYKQNNIFNLMHIFYTEMLNTTNLLEHISHENSDTKELYHIYASLSSQLAYLNEICILLSKFKLIYKKIA